MEYILNTKTNKQIELSPKLARYFEFIKTRHESHDADYILLCIFSYISRVLCFYRLKIEVGFGESYFFPNFYFFAFLNSASGKDRTKFFVREEGAEIEAEMLKELQEQKEIEENRLLEDLDSKRKKLSKDDRLHEPCLITDEGTREGFLAIRKTYEKYGIGIIHYEQSEFLNNFRQGDMAMLYSVIEQAWERGDNYGKVIAGNKKPVNVKEVPQTFAAHASLMNYYSLPESQRNEFLRFFTNGFARRSYVCYHSESRKKKRITPEERFKNRERAGELAPFIKTLLKEIKDFCRSLLYLEPQGSSFHLTDNVRKLYYEYLDECEEKSEKINEKKYGWRTVEMNGRAWKCLRLAGIISCIEHIREKEVRDTDFLLAKELTEYFSQQYGDLFTQGQILEEELLFDFILENQKKGIMTTKMNIREQSFAPCSKNAAKWLKELLEQMPEYCLEHNMEFIENKGEKNLFNYQIQRLGQHESSKGKEISFTLSMSKDNAKNYEPQKFSWKEGDIQVACCTPDWNYSAGIFKGRYRKGENIKTGTDIIILDVDNVGEEELTMKECQNRFKEFVCAFLPTRNHQKIKNKDAKEIGKREARDRYRVLLPLCEPFDFVDKERYKRIYQNLIEGFHLEKYTDAGASCDCSRYYYASPTKEVFVNSGEKILDWRVFDFVKEEPPRIILPQTEKKFNYSQERFSTNSQEFESKAIPTDKVPWEQYQYLTSGQKKSYIKCYFHEDKHPSAYAWRAEKWLYFHCCACNKTWTEIRPYKLVSKKSS